MEKGKNKEQKEKLSKERVKEIRMIERKKKGNEKAKRNIGKRTK